MSTLRLALSDPGALVPRRFDCGPEADETEPLTDWQARAVAVWLREYAEVYKGSPDPAERQIRYEFRAVAGSIESRQL